MKNIWSKLTLSAVICILAITQSHHFNRPTELILSIGVPVLACLFWLVVYFKQDNDIRN